MPLAPQQAATPAPPYYPALDGLRGLSVLAVFAIHLNGYHYPGGWIGVDIFFVLSGFLITSLLVREWERTRTIDLKNFYFRRALRLLPALFLMLAPVWLYAELRLPKVEARMTRQGVLSAVGYYANWRLSKGVAMYDLLPHTWSLSIEEQFYFLWPPMLYVLLWMRCRRRVILTVVAAGIAASALYRGFHWQGVMTVLPSYMSFRTRADSLLVGCLAGLLVTWRGLPRPHSWWRRLVHLVALAALPYLSWVFLKQQFILDWWHRGGYTVLAILAAILIVAAIDDHFLIAPAFKFPPLVWIGRLSYGFYLWHFPIISITNRTKLPSRLTEWQQAVFFLTVTLLVTSLSYYALERPLLQRKRKKPARVTEPRDEAPRHAARAA